MASRQAPLGSGFGATSTAADVIDGIDLSGKTAIVTGGHSGLGLETTRALVSAGAEVIVPSRTEVKALDALAGINGIVHAEMDLMDPHSVRAFADDVVRSGRAIHILVNSAGVMATPLRRDARGCESQFATNHLGHFQLVAQLWTSLRRAKGARVISVSSRAHQFAPFDFHDPCFKTRPYDKWIAYGQSKVANALFAVALDMRGKADAVRAFSLHPGTILTNLTRELSEEELQAFGVSRSQALGFVPPGASIAEGGDYKTLEQGAATAVWCSTSPQLDGLGGVYCENVDIAAVDLGDGLSQPGVKPWAIDPAAATRLWELSEQLAAGPF